MSDLYKNLIEYSNSDYYPFHMPGHKRNIEDGVSPFSYDITEIDGFDNLHNPQGILKIAMEEAAEFYCTDKTYYLVNGSTCGLLSAICGVTSRGDKILVARNCHKAVYNAVYLNELTPVYINPEYIEMYGINGGISPEVVRYELAENPDIKAVIITSPTYEGVVSDVQRIAEIVHKRGIPLIVDEAHGAHFGLHTGFPQSAVKSGADIVIQSVHKTLPSLTQTALLHIRSDIVNVSEVERFLHIYQSSSPSYVLMSSIDECINKLKSDGLFLFEPYVKRLEVMLTHEKQLTHLKIVGREIVGKNAVYDLDPSKIVISVRGTSYTGSRLYKEMLEKYHLQLEMASGDYAIAMTSPMDTEDGLLRLFMAMVEIDRDMRIYGDDTKNEVVNYMIPKPIVMENIYKATHSDTEEMLIENAVGKISNEFVYLYPPGSPILAPGELITNDIVKLINDYKESGLSVEGLRDSSAEYIRVIKEEFRRINLTKGYYHLNV
ncbi:MAG: aminotransferase class I/II-fold pyridoxal phosphate-dependent enzyme [Lachnospiraceae bacterium]|nr:aminotransferase class I/II-fold pyridoxal phosphate-dependent enzyme [Clostridiales bacterium]MDD6293463.1 aminotransferase class I/II-fold pyridoxal phosphate-dependent enzyme [Eubacteriales bacterium]MDY2608075.1 aminotransferase class I/II-fold pyridoxal phosphate-dependent enzyme [Lachnospiraceae bacterium]